VTAPWVDADAGASSVTERGLLRRMRGHAASRAHVGYRSSAHRCRALGEPTVHPSLPRRSSWRSP